MKRKRCCFLICFTDNTKKNHSNYGNIKLCLGCKCSTEKHWKNEDESNMTLFVSQLSSGRGSDCTLIVRGGINEEILFKIKYVDYFACHLVWFYILGIPYNKKQ